MKTFLYLYSQDLGKLEFRGTRGTEAGVRNLDTDSEALASCFCTLVKPLKSVVNTRNYDTRISV